MVTVRPANPRVSITAIHEYIFMKQAVAKTIADSPGNPSREKTGSKNRVINANAPDTFSNNTAKETGTVMESSQRPVLKAFGSASTTQSRSFSSPYFFFESFSFVAQFVIVGFFNPGGLPEGIVSISAGFKPGIKNRRGKHHENQVADDIFCSRQRQDIFSGSELTVP